MRALISQIDENQRKIDAHGKFDEAVWKKINYKLRLEWNYHSNRMEGGTLTMAETRSIMIGLVDVKGKSMKDVMEMKGHAQVTDEVLKIGKSEMRIAERRIKALHKAIMYEENMEDAAQIGEWKDLPNHLYNYLNEKIEFTPPTQVPEAMHRLLDSTNAELDKFHRGKPSKHPLEIAAQFHIEFVTIHPFYDGNGRMARILTNLLLISCGYPPIIIKDELKTAYGRYLADIQVHGGDASLFHQFIGERLIETQQLILDALAGKNIEEPSDLDKQIAMLERTIDGMDEDIQQTKNQEVLKLMRGEVVTPLFKRLAEKLLKVRHLFMEAEFSYFINHYDDSNYGNTNTDADTLLDTMFLSWLGNEDHIDSVFFHIDFKKLKKLLTRGIDVSTSLKISFEHHKYVVSFGSFDPIERLYHQRLSSEEMDEIATNFLKNIVNDIEARVAALKQ